MVLVVVMVMVMVVVVRGGGKRPYQFDVLFHEYRDSLFCQNINVN